MNHRSDLRLAVLNCASENDRLLVIHSSLAHFRLPPNVGKWDFLYVVRELLDRGLTLAFPTFTFSVFEGRPFHLSESASEMGVLGNWVLQLGDFERSRHPVYSFAMAGPLAGEILQCTNTTTFGPDSTFAAFERLNARVMMLGCGWSCCTQFHKYEEDFQVPYRFYKTFDTVADYGDGPTGSEVRMFVRDLDAGDANDFTPVLDRLYANNEIRRAPIWGGAVESASCTDMAAAFRAILSEDPYGLVENARAVAHRVSQKSMAESEPPIKVALLGSANLTLIERGIANVLRTLVGDREIEIFVPQYGQMAQEILDPESDLNGFKADFAIFLDRLEDLLGASTLEDIDTGTLEDAVEQYIATVHAYHKAQSSTIFVNRFAHLSPSVAVLAVGATKQGPPMLVNKFNTRLEEALGGLPEVNLFDIAEAAIGYRDGPVLDDRLWFLGRFPYADGFSRHLAEKYSALVLAATGRTARLIVTDLDNTLWGGVLGEDGIGELKLGGDYPGNAYLAFQKTLKSLSARGFALALCSKNDEEAALDAVASHPDMALKPEDFVAHRINWAPKWQNVEEICGSLGIGPANVLFIDDNPVEREQMRQFLPAVQILDLPDDPALFSETLLRSPWTQSLNLTPEDLKRTQKYRAREAVIKQRSQFTDLESFFASLNTKIHFSPLDDGNAARAVQLINKTNQFNATARRYNQARLQEIVAEGAEVVVIGLEDKFSEFENVGILILRWDRPRSKWVSIDNYLLSCRVLGRGIETGVLYWLREKAAEKGADGIYGEVIETERNLPVRSVFQEAGFTADEQPGRWRLELNSDRRRLPAWLSVVDRIETGL